MVTNPTVSNTFTAVNAIGDGMLATFTSLVPAPSGKLALYGLSALADGVWGTGSGATTEGSISNGIIEIR